MIASDEFRVRVLKGFGIDFERLHLCDNLDSFSLATIEQGILYFYLRPNPLSHRMLRHIAECLAPLQPIDFYVLDREVFWKWIHEHLRCPEHSAGSLFWVRAGQVFHQENVLTKCDSIQRISRECFG